MHKHGRQNGLNHSAEWSVDNWNVISLKSGKVYEFKFYSQQHGKSLTVKLGISVVTSVGSPPNFVSSFFYWTCQTVKYCTHKSYKTTNKVEKHHGSVQ